MKWLLASVLFLSSSFALSQEDELTDLIPYTDLAVIQRKGLPKTGRFEIHLGATTVLNDAFFDNFGGTLKFNYSFVEQWALELTHMQVSPSPKAFTVGLEQDRGILATSRVSPTSFSGLSLRYNPFYGKLSFMDESIIPVDFYLSLGAIQVNTNQGTSETGLHMGIGQIFALNKDFAFRWDFSYFLYEASFTIRDNRTQTQQSGRGQFGNLYLSVGFSYFFPEAPYR